MPKVKGGRRTEEEKQTAKCQGAVDFYTQDVIDEEFYAIRIKEGGFYHCFDIRSLFKWFETGKITNPLTGLKFSPENIAKIKKKFIKVGLNFIDPNEKLNEEDLELLDKVMNIQGFDIRVMKPNWDSIDQNSLNYDCLAFVGDRGYDIILSFGLPEIVIFTLSRNFDTIVNQLTQLFNKAPDNVEPAYTEWEFE